MTTRRSPRWLTMVALVAALGTGCHPSRATAQAPTHVSPPPSVPAAAVAPVGWIAIERRVRRGVSRGVAAFRFEVADREDVAATAMERAWRAYTATPEPIRNPEAWGKTIALRVGLDEIRRQKRERAHVQEPVDAELVGDMELFEDVASAPRGPLELAVASERRERLQERIARWPVAERRLAELMLDGQAETVTAAAWMVRAEEEAAGLAGSMYPLKARVLLDARRGELEDLV